MNRILLKQMVIVQGILIVLASLLVSCGEVPLAVPEVEQVAQPPPTQQSTPTATATQEESLPAVSTATATSLSSRSTATIETTPTLETVPTLSGPFPIGPKIVYVENRHDAAFTFWAASPINPGYRLPLAKVNGFNDFGINAALSHTGHMIAFVALPEGSPDNRLAADLWVINIDGSGQQKVAAGVYFNGPSYPFWSPDDGYLVFVRATVVQDVYEATTIWMLNLNTGEETILAESNVDERQFVWPLGWSQDGSGFYYRLNSETGSEVRLFTLQASSRTPVISLPNSTNLCNMSPDTSQLLCNVLVDRELSQWDLMIFPFQSEQKPAVVDTYFTKKREDYFLYIWQPDSQSFTIGKNLTEDEDNKTTAQKSADLQVINAQTRNLEKTISLQQPGNYQPRSWSPDGMWLVTQSALSPGGNLYFSSKDGQAFTYLPADGAIDVLGWLTIDIPLKSQ